MAPSRVGFARGFLVAGRDLEWALLGRRGFQETADYCKNPDHRDARSRPIERRMEAAGSMVAATAATAFPIEETHGIPLYPGNRLLAHSGSLGWRNIASM
jgi:hypothetical protein